MKAFGELLDRLAFESARGAKLRLLEAYFRSTPDPDRGFALAALTGTLSFTHAKPSLAWEICAERVAPELISWSYDYVGDLAETVALIWPASSSAPDLPRLEEVVTSLAGVERDAIAPRLRALLDRLDAIGRWALLKLVTGNPRVGVSARLAKTAVAAIGSIGVEAVEEVWHALEPPYLALFEWLEGRGPRPDTEQRPTFRPPMLAHAITERDLASLSPEDWIAEWKWDGIRVQLVGVAGQVRLFSRSGEDLTAAFPDVIAPYQVTLDGELLIVRDGVAAPFADLQKRLNRKKVSAALLRDHPAFIRLYDLLFEAQEDLRALPFAERRRRLEAWFAKERRPRMDLSPLVPFESWAELEALRARFEQPAVEGVMLKRKDSPYLAGRPKGWWWKWKRDPLLVDAVLMYAQRGSGKRSSYYSDYTFGVWTEHGELVPVGKAYFGFTDEELTALDRWIRGHTVGRFGPVREVEKALVLEVAFEGLQRSSRHKSGLAMRFPRIRRIRWDKPAAEADRLATLFDLVSFLEARTET